MPIAKEFLGAGWKFPVQTRRDNSGHALGRIAMSRYEEHIRESIEIILGTAFGERVMRPDFGCGIHELVFAPNVEGVHSLAQHYVRQALQNWEPRIDVAEVAVQADPHDAAIMQIDVKYQVRATNNERNLVYPFYLKRGVSP